jgi:hypothetical protein
VTEVFPTPPFWFSMVTIAPMAAMLPRPWGRPAWARSTGCTVQPVHSSLNVMPLAPAHTYGALP